MSRAKASSLKAHQVLVLSRTIDVCPDPVALYRRCAGGRLDTLLLESADQTTSSGEKSLVMTRAALRLCCRGQTVNIEALSNNGRSLLPSLADQLRNKCELIDGPDKLVARFSPPASGSERQRLAAPSVLDVLRSTVLNLEVVGGQPRLPPLCFGSFGYDLIACYEALPDAKSDPGNWPDYEMWLAEEVISIQHRARRSTVLRYVFGGAHAEPSYHDASTGLALAVEHCQSEAASVQATSSQAPSHAPEGSETDMDDACFGQLVSDLKEHIIRGDVFQIVPSRTFSKPCSDPLAAYAALRALNPSPYMFFLRGENGTLFGASPESALTVHPQGDGSFEVAINPIAGTRGRGRHADGTIDADLDTRIEAELRLDEKEVAEHMMLVDLARNDVARVSRAGTRSVRRLLDVVRYSHVMHLVSLVTGQLKHEFDALHAYVATMNMGTLVGAPKIKAATLLRECEPSRRGPYGGAVGYLTADGELDTCIVIRSALVQDGVAQVRAGCGVVYDSDPASEALETRRKAQAVLNALAAVEAD